MRKKLRIVFAMLLGSGLAVTQAKAAAVTYSASVDNITLGVGGTANVFLSQFDATKLDGYNASYTYTLTKAVITLDSTIHGTISFYNGTAANAFPQLVPSGVSVLKYEDIATDNLYYTIQTFGKVLPGGSLVNTPATLTSTGSKSSSDIVSSLGRFIGSGSITTLADFTEVTAGLVIGNDQSGSVALVGLANASITYTYTEVVPEPCSMTLLGLGCAALALRRRRVTKV